MDATYTATINESKSDLELLRKNNYQFLIAKSVSKPGGKPTFNISTGSIGRIPEAGKEIRYSGTWQTCKLGQSYDLGINGIWAINDNNPFADSKSLNVGKNGYKDPVYIVVGVQDSDTKTWSPIWINHDALLRMAHGEYQPHERVKLWFEQDRQSENIAPRQGTPTLEVEMSPQTPTYHFSYDAIKGDWRLPQSTPFTN
ncbi:splicing factor 3b [Fusarium austroafricanum]|uniref:Splicing factor 3b n=1 Tax=Fusarium austroafricanum TaxID=2364996 RepID=A0A8H4KAP8_9HYPO|nr:splicing factor 3b [Fusarium austroafricanum]